MPPLTATSKPLEPVTLSPICVKESEHGARAAWVEKVVASQVDMSASCPSKQHLSRSESKCDRNTGNNDAGGEYNYGEELQKYIAEATANLEEPLDDSDASDEDSSDEDTDSLSPCSDDIFDLAGDDMDDFVVPPVEIPRCYRTQDLRGGVAVGGDYVLFTNWAFKRQQRCMRHLRPIPERRDTELPLSDGVNETRGRYSGKIVEL